MAGESGAVVEKCLVRGSPAWRTNRWDDATLGGHVWRQGMCRTIDPGARTSRTGPRWALSGVVVSVLGVDKYV